MAQRPARQRSRRAVRAFLDERGIGHLGDDQLQAVPPDVRTRVLADIAATRPGVLALVLTVPDRFGGDPRAWWELAGEFAAAGYAVVVTSTDASAYRADHRRVGPPVDRPVARRARLGRTRTRTRTRTRLDSGEALVSALRMSVGELRRITSGRLPKIAVVALSIIPLLYGGLYLYANHDPYANLRHVPAALVVQDTGTTTVQGTRFDAGAQVARDLVASRSFAWSRTGEADALAGVAHRPLRLRDHAAAGLLRGAGVVRQVPTAAGGARPHHQRREQLPGAHHRRPGDAAGPQLSRRPGRRDGGQPVPQRVRDHPPAADPGGVRGVAARDRRRAGAVGGGDAGVGRLAARRRSAPAAGGLGAAGLRGGPGGGGGVAALRRSGAARDRARHAAGVDRLAAVADPAAGLRRATGRRGQRADRRRRRPGGHGQRNLDRRPHDVPGPARPGVGRAGADAGTAHPGARADGPAPRSGGPGGPADPGRHRSARRAVVGLVPGGGRRGPAGGGSPGAEQRHRVGGVRSLVPRHGHRRAGLRHASGRDGREPARQRRADRGERRRPAPLGRALARRRPG